jgi:hypothetical protein
MLHRNFRECNEDDRADEGICAYWRIVPMTDEGVCVAVAKTDKQGGKGSAKKR